jgi:flagellar basal body-associated protein FliL
MQNNEAKLGGTFFIWLAVTIIILVLLIAGQFNWIFGAFLIIGAAIGTGSIWSGHHDTETKADAAPEKIKRRTRVEDFVNNLNDDELEELRARLLDNADGELVSVDDLLYEMDKRARR